MSTDPSRLDLEVIHGFLLGAYWCRGIPRDLVERSIQASLSFGLYHGARQVGFARVITDAATFAYLGDVFVLEEWRGRGLSKWLMECVVAHPALQGLRRFLLATQDAHGLYSRFGFRAVTRPERLMEIVDLEIYSRKPDPSES